MITRLPELILGVGGLLSLIAAMTVVPALERHEVEHDRWAIIDSEFVVFSTRRSPSAGNETVVVEG